MKKLLISVLLIIISTLFVFQIAKQSEIKSTTSPQVEPEQQTVDSAHPKNIQIPEGSKEVTAQRDTNKVVYQNPDGTFTALFTQEPIHYKAEDGTYQDIDLTYEKDGARYISSKNSVNTIVQNNELTVADPDKKAQITWLADSPITVQDNIATYKDKNGNTWKYTNTTSGVKLETTIAKRQGKKTYTFAYKYDGELSVDPSSGALNGDGFVIPISFAKGKNDQIIYASPWVINDNSTVSFTIDDSEFPDSAFPYVLDPTTSFNAGTDDGYLRCAYNSYLIYLACQQRVVSDTSTSLIVGQAMTGSGPFTSYYGYESFISFDTSSLDDNAIIYNAQLKLYGSTAYAGDDQIVVAQYDWSSPLGTSDWRFSSSLSSLAPVAAISSNFTINSYVYFSNYGNALSQSINKTGMSKYIIYSQRYVDATSPNSDQTSIFSSANGANPPVMEITYGIMPTNTMQFEGLKMEGIRAD